MTIQHKETGDEGVFFLEENKEMKAQLVYSKPGDNTLVIEHTEVDKSLRGNQIGYELVHKTVEFARSNGLKVSPLCPFAKAQFDRHADFQNVLA